MKTDAEKVTLEMSYEEAGTLAYLVEQAVRDLESDNMTHTATYRKVLAMNEKLNMEGAG